MSISTMNCTDCSEAQKILGCAMVSTIGQLPGLTTTDIHEMLDPMACHDGLIEVEKAGCGHQPESFHTTLKGLQTAFRECPCETTTDVGTKRVTFPNCKAEICGGFCCVQKVDGTDCDAIGVGGTKTIKDVYVNEDGCLVIDAEEKYQSFDGGNYIGFDYERGGPLRPDLTAGDYVGIPATEINPDDTSPESWFAYNDSATAFTDQGFDDNPWCYTNSSCEKMSVNVQPTGNLSWSHDNGPLHFDSLLQYQKNGSDWTNLEIRAHREAGDYAHDHLEFGLSTITDEILPGQTCCYNFRFLVRVYEGTYKTQGVNYGINTSGGTVTS